MPRGTAIALIHRIRWKIDRFLEKELKEQGIDNLVLSQNMILYILHREDAKLTMSQIASLAMKDKSTVTYLVDKLAAAGYVRRQKHPDDSRVTYVLLTEKARALQPYFAAISERAYSAVYNSLTEREAEVLEHLLERINDALPVC